ncbi:MAG TPA: hypothetical protein ENI80_11865 [Acidiferrobacteraceae bacterium]|nr:hypothetical protein [Acidiferrobacteraceae bacterium]
MLPEGVFTDWGGGASNVFPTTSDTFTMDAGRTWSFDIVAINEDGQTEDREILYSKIPVGYHAATVPGAPVRESDLRLIRSYLEDIDRRLNDNVLTTLPGYIEEHNRRIPDDDAEYRFPAFGDMAYLSGGVGTGNLTDDILNAMRDVLIYISANTLPRGYRPGTITVPEREALCSSGAVYGISTREWVSICRDIGANGLTLLHELFHYASTSNNGDETRAFAISMCAYNILP